MYGASFGIFKVHASSLGIHIIYICLPNFVEIGPSATELWRHIFFKTAATASQFYFRFRFRDFAHLGRSTSTCIPNFGEISQSTAEVLLYFRFLKTNVRYVGILLPVPIFTFASPTTCQFVSVYQISSKSDHPRQSYDVIFIFQDGDRQPYWIISTLLQTTHKVQMGCQVGPQISTTGFIVSEIMLFLLWGCLEIAYLHGCTYFDLWGSICLSSSNFPRRSWSFKGCLLTKPPMLDPFWAEIFRPVENRPKICVFWRKWGQNVKICSRDPQKVHPCAKRLLTYWSSKSAQRPRGSELEESKKLAEWTFGRQLRIILCGGKIP